MKHPLGYYVFQATFSLLEKDEKAGSLPSNPRICWVFRFVVIIPYGHYYASVLQSLNVPDKYAMENMGHETDHMLKTVYQHTMSEKRKEVDAEIDGYFG